VAAAFAFGGPESIKADVAIAIMTARIAALAIPGALRVDDGLLYLFMDISEFVGFAHWTVLPRHG
jgi:hypothetical protein